MEELKIKRKKIKASKKSHLHRIKRIFGFYADSYCQKCRDMGIDPAYATRILKGNIKGTKSREWRQKLIDEANRLDGKKTVKNSIPPCVDDANSPVIDAQ